MRAAALDWPDACWDGSGGNVGGVPDGAMTHRPCARWLHPRMALRTGSESDSRRGTAGVHTDRQCVPLSAPRRYSTPTHLPPTPDSLPSTKRAEQSLETYQSANERHSLCSPYTQLDSLCQYGPIMMQAGAPSADFTPQCGYLDDVLVS